MEYYYFMSMLKISWRCGEKNNLTKSFNEWGRVSHKVKMHWTKFKFVYIGRKWIHSQSNTYIYD